MDEAAIWKRALSPAEIEALFDRGALSLELQFRACADGVCDDEPFVGPDGTSASAFTAADLGSASSGNWHGLGLVGLVGQYQARFSTAAGTRSPGLLRVTVEAREP